MPSGRFFAMSCIWVALQFAHSFIGTVVAANAFVHTNTSPSDRRFVMCSIFPVELCRLGKSQEIGKRDNTQVRDRCLRRQPTSYEWNRQLMRSKIHISSAGGCRLQSSRTPGMRDQLGSKWADDLGGTGRRASLIASYPATGRIGSVQFRLLWHPPAPTAQVGAAQPMRSDSRPSACGSRRACRA
jgi:hypothetical protein